MNDKRKPETAENTGQHNRSASESSGMETGAPGTPSGPLALSQRWTAARKREVVLRLLRGEPLETLSRELGVEPYRLASWREKALLGIDTALKGRSGDFLQGTLDTAMQRIGELTMANDLLRERVRHPGPLPKRRS
jgi:hypothetical protein